MSSFEIIGGHKLHGEIYPQGAKNEALQVICAVLLTSEKVVIDNIPDISDVNKLISLLQLLGVKVRRLNDDTRLLVDGRSYEFQADEVNLSVLTGEEFAKQASALRESDPRLQDKESACDYRHFFCGRDEAAVARDYLEKKGII